jgi:hypothetical protein
VRDTGDVVHKVAIEDGLRAPVWAVSNGKQSASISFTLDRPGSYTFFCSQPGHGNGAHWPAPAALGLMVECFLVRTARA